jgi:hypothetical protein
MAELLLTYDRFLHEGARELQLMKPYGPPIELQWANQFINLRRPKRESL